MTLHASRWELVHSGPRRFYARLIAGNGEEVARTPETYTTRRAAMDAIATTVLLGTAALHDGRVRNVEERG